MDFFVLRLCGALVCFFVIAYFYFRFLYLDFRGSKYVKTDAKACLVGMVQRVEAIDFLPWLLVRAPNTARGCRAQGIFLICLSLAPYLVWVLIFVTAIPKPISHPLTLALSALIIVMSVGIAARFLYRFSDRFDLLKPLMTLFVTYAVIAIIFLQASVVTWLFCPIDGGVAAMAAGVGYFFCWLLHRLLKCGIALYTLPQACTEAGIPVTKWLQLTRSLRRLVPNVVGLKNAKHVKFYVNAVWAGVLQNFALLLSFVARMFIPGPAVIDRLLSVTVFSITRRLRRHWAKVDLAGGSAERVGRASVLLRTFPHDSLLATANCDNPVSIEERIIRALLSGGHRVVALGKPGEDMPPLGAERYYVPDADWQRIISSWVSQSFSVVMVAGVSRATHWEIEEIIRLGVNDRLLILFPLELWDRSEARDTTVDFEKSVSERFEEIGLSGIDRSLLTKGEMLIGAKITADKKLLLLSTPDKSYKSTQEAIKFHLANLQEEPGAEGKTASEKFFLEPNSSDADLKFEEIEGELVPEFLGAWSRTLPFISDAFILFWGTAVAAGAENTPIVGITAAALYFGIFESVAKGTPGSLFFGARVNGTDGQKLNLLDATFRFTVFWGLVWTIGTLSTVVGTLTLFLPEGVDAFRFVWEWSFLWCFILTLVLVISCIRSPDGRSIVDRWFGRMVVSRPWSGKFCVLKDDCTADRPRLPILARWGLGVICFVAVGFGDRIEQSVKDLAYSESGTPLEMVVFAKANVEKGTTIQSKDVELRPVPTRRKIEGSLVELPVGKVAKSKLTEGIVVSVSEIEGGEAQSSSEQVQ
ncbi:MAG: RDD family protein [Candidatus Obscuribacterales bacterium]